MKIGNPEAEIAARKLFDEFGEDGIGCAVDRRHGFGIEDEVPCRLRQAAHDPADPIAHVIDIEEQQAALHEVNGKTRQGPRLRLAMQLVEGMAVARNASQQRIARAGYAGEQINAGSGNRDEYALEDSETDDPRHRDQREREIGAARLPQAPQLRRVEQIDCG